MVFQTHAHVEKYETSNTYFARQSTCQRSHTSRHGDESEIPISTLGTSHMLHGVQHIFEVPVLSRKAWRTKLSSSHHIELAKHS